MGLRVLVLAAILAGTGCSSISTVRVQSDTVHISTGHASPNLRPIAVIHAQVTSAYVLFIPIPGNVSLDRVVNQMLIATAKSLGADKVVDIKVELTPEDGIWTLRKLIGWRSASASGVAVVVEEPRESPAPKP